MPNVRLTGQALTALDVARIAVGARVLLDEKALLRADADATWLARRPEAEVLGTKWMWLVGGTAPKDRSSRVRAFVLGHCAGVGDPLPIPIVRAMMAVRANVLLAGASGCRASTIKAIAAWLNAEVTPVVPSLGAVGAAGAAPLAHVARALCGFGGPVFTGPSFREGAPPGLPMVDPTEKEALSLINGDSLTAACAALAVVRARSLLETALAACALSFEASHADRACLDSRALGVRQHPGGIEVGRRLRALLDGSHMVSAGEHADAFSLRCAPAVLGSAWDAVEHVTGVVERELNAAVDNPLVFAPDAVVEAGHFHGAPVALALDWLRPALTSVASIAERRIFRLTTGDLSGLPSFLVAGTGLNNGLMLAQYTAASLVSECKGLSHPASVDSLPTVQAREDHVSMGPVAARLTLELTECVADVLGIELMCAAQGVDLRQDAGQKGLGAGTNRVHRAVRSRVTRCRDDRVLHPDLVAVGKLVREGVFADLLPWAGTP